MANEILIDAGLGETRVALVEGGRLVQVSIDRPGLKSAVGGIWLGRVSRVVPGMQAAFVELGLGKAGFLSARDARVLAPSATPESGEPPPIGTLVREGQALAVQVTKDPVGDKGVRLTADLVLPGRYLAHTPLSPGVHLSRRLTDAAERARLQAALADLPGAGGFILRTAAAGATPEELRAEAARLRVEWTELTAAARFAKPPAALWRDLDPVARALRDHLTRDVARVRINSAVGLAAAKNYLAGASPELLDRLQLHQGPEALFDLYHVEDDLRRALQRRIALPSGGAITIDATAALTVIDVDSGTFTSGQDLETTSRRVNQEAAAEIARQLRLRGIGGIIVIDFIHLQDPAHRDELMAGLNQALAADRAPTRVLGLSEFGLVEMTRKRTGEPLAWSFSEACERCGGEGRLPSPGAVAADLLRRARREAALAPGRPLLLLAAPEVLNHLEEGGALAALAAETGARVTPKADPGCRRHEFEVMPEGQR